MNMNEGPIDGAKAGVGLMVGGGRGEGRGKWCWENGDNCIQTSIKKK